jgi:small GTP-binding protein
VIVVGDIGVGKTSLLRRMANFDPLSVVDAVPIDYLSKMAVVEKAPAPMKVQLWDTAGQEEFGAARLPSSYFRQAKAAIVVYDVTDRLSFAGVLRWATQIQAYQAHSSSSSSFALTLVGHKADVSNEARRVAASEGRELAKLIAASDFIECSSKDNTNVQTCFNAVAAALASGASWALSHTPLPSIDLISADLGQPSAPSCRHVACSALQLRAVTSTSTCLHKDRVLSPTLRALSSKHESPVLGAPYIGTLAVLLSMPLVLLWLDDEAVLSWAEAVGGW